MIGTRRSAFRNGVTPANDCAAVVVVVVVSSIALESSVRLAPPSFTGSPMSPLLVDGRRASFTRRGSVVASMLQTRNSQGGNSAPKETRPPLLLQLANIAKFIPTHSHCATKQSEGGRALTETNGKCGCKYSSSSDGAWVTRVFLSRVVVLLVPYVAEKRFADWCGWDARKHANWNNSPLRS